MRICGYVIGLLLALTPGALRADLEVHTHRDTVVLEDGTEIACRVLMLTQKGVLVVVADPDDAEKKSQRIIPSEKIRSIIRDERNGVIEGLLTETELARKVIKGAGFRKAESAAGKTDKNDSKGVAENGGRPDAAKGSGKLKKTAGGDNTPASPFAKSGKSNGPGPFADALGKTPNAGAVDGQDVKVEMPTGTLAAKDLTDAYLTRFPDLKNTGLELLGEAQIQDWFNAARDGNDSARKPLENLLKAYLGANDKEKGPARSPVRGDASRTPRRPVVPLPD